MSAPVQQSQTERLLAVLRERGAGVHLNCKELAAASGVPHVNVAALLRHAADAGVVEIGGAPRRHTYALTGKTVEAGRRMNCPACGENVLRKGAVLVPGLGYCCSACGKDPQRMAAGRAKKAQMQGQQIGDWPKRRGPDWASVKPGGNPYTESLAPWRPATVQRKPSEPAQPADGPNVTRAPSRNYDPRYQVEPGTRVLGGFATMGIGRYLDGGTNA